MSMRRWLTLLNGRWLLSRCRGCTDGINASQQFDAFRAGLSCSLDECRGPFEPSIQDSQMDDIVLQLLRCHRELIGDCFLSHGASPDAHKNALGGNRFQEPSCAAGTGNSNDAVASGIEQ
jgi:hypothetical protein